MAGENDWYPFKSAALSFNSGYVALVQWTASDELVGIDTGFETAKFSIDYEAAKWHAKFTRPMKTTKRELTQTLGVSGRVFDLDRSNRSIELSFLPNKGKDVLKKAAAELYELKSVLCEQLRLGELIARGVLENVHQHAAGAAEQVSPAKFSLYQLIDAENGVFQEPYGKAILDLHVADPKVVESAGNPKPKPQNQELILRRLQSSIDALPPPAFRKRQILQFVADNIADTAGLVTAADLERRVRDSLGDKAPKDRKTYLAAFEVIKNLS